MEHYTSQMEVRSHLEEEIIEKAFAELASSILPPGERIVYHTDNLELFDKAVTLCLQHYRVQGSGRNP
jgi:tRNA G46 methylase TrmB